jgi:hypothetical protein
MTSKNNKSKNRDRFQSTNSKWSVCPFPKKIRRKNLNDKINIM